MIITIYILYDFFFNFIFCVGGYHSCFFFALAPTCTGEQFSTSKACEIAKANDNDHFCDEDESCLPCSNCSEADRVAGYCPDCGKLAYIYRKNTKIQFYLWFLNHFQKVIKRTTKRILQYFQNLVLRLTKHFDFQYIMYISSYNKHSEYHQS